MLSRELKVGIVGGVISSILVIIFIQPILGFMWNSILAFGESIQAGYVDRIYRNAAIGDRNLVGHTSLLVLLLLLATVSTAFISRKYFIMMSLVSLCMSFGFLIIFSISSGVMEINASFNQRLTVMAPAISDKEYKEWRAQWAKMRSQGNYRELVSAMEKRSLELKIQLPELRNP